MCDDEIDIREMKLVRKSTNLMGRNEFDVR